MLRSKSDKPRKTVDDLRLEEEKFIAAANPDGDEANHNVIEPAPKEKKVVGKSKVAKPVVKTGDIMDRHQFVRRGPWPMIPSEKPSYAEGRDDIDKPLIMRVKERRWLSIERHCQVLGISKTQWVLHACDMLMAEEQKWFEKNQEK